MKNASIILFGIFLSFFTVSCGDSDEENECASAAWVGTYELASADEAECEYAPMATIVFNDEIEIELGDSDATISWDGFIETLSGCSVNDGIMTLTLSDNTITSTIGACSALYTRK